MPCSVLDVEDIAVNKIDKVSILMELYTLGTVYYLSR